MLALFLNIWLFSWFQVWYDLPSDVFFNAISSIDRFLAKMKAQPKHLSCIAVASFHLACLQHQKLQQEQVCKNQRLLRGSSKAPQRLLRGSSKAPQRLLTGSSKALQRAFQISIYVWSNLHILTNSIICIFELNFKTLVIFNFQYHSKSMTLPTFIKIRFV